MSKIRIFEGVVHNIYDSGPKMIAVQAADVESICLQAEYKCPQTGKEYPPRPCIVTRSGNKFTLREDYNFEDLLKWWENSENYYRRK